MSTIQKAKNQREVYGLYIDGQLSEELTMSGRLACLRADEERINRGGKRQRDGSVFDPIRKIRDNRADCCGVNIRFLRYEEA